MFVYKLEHFLHLFGTFTRAIVREPTFAGKVGAYPYNRFVREGSYSWLLGTFIHLVTLYYWLR